MLSRYFTILSILLDVYIFKLTKNIDLLIGKMGKSPKPANEVYRRQFIFFCCLESICIVHMCVFDQSILLAPRMQKLWPIHVYIPKKHQAMCFA